MSASSGSCLLSQLVFRRRQVTALTLCTLTVLEYVYTALGGSLELTASDRWTGQALSYWYGAQRNHVTGTMYRWLERLHHAHLPTCAIMHAKTSAQGEQSRLSPTPGES